MDTVLHTLQQDHQFDPSQIKTDAESLEHWGKDWTKHFAPAASAIVFPKTIEQVQAL
ncbi:FAD-binding oxidoreductase, partial [Psychrobacter sp. APC 3426]|nr:FAD-binding oxidoreductase [Psychrobacter sp. APC 3426]